MNATGSQANHSELFGYGSLVNELTLAKKLNARPGSLSNWIREWKHCVEAPFGRVCALTIARQDNVSIQGVYITCPDTEFEELDKREIGYQRDTLRVEDVGEPIPEQTRAVFAYTSNPSAHRPGSTTFPIWLSYVEVVLYGYLQVFGAGGVDEFIRTTRGWSAPVVDDRDKPLYPRAVDIPTSTRNIIEASLKKIPEFQVDWI
jgi:cation transport protein ChaC